MFMVVLLFLQKNLDFWKLDVADKYWMVQEMRDINKNSWNNVVLCFKINYKKRMDSEKKKFEDIRKPL